MKFEIGSKTYQFGRVKAEAKSKPGQVAAKDSVIISQLAKEAVDRARAEIKKWRDAMTAIDDPDNPRWALLQDLLDNLSTDGHLMACIQIRKAATLSSRFYVKDKITGKEQDEKTALFMTEWFHTLLDQLLDSVTKAYTVVELSDPAVMGWTMWPRRNVCPQKHRLYFEAFGDKHIVYTDPAFTKNVLELRSSHQFGILNDIVPQLIWKRNAQQAWADFTERFGIPLVSATTNKSDKKELDRIQTMLDALGQSATALLPEGTTITIHDQSTKGDPYKIFQEQIKTSNEEVSKRILGGTMITDNGAARSQSEIHERTLDQKIAESDRRMIEFFVNGRLMPLLRQWGFSFADNDQFIFDRSEELNLSDHWKIVNEASQTYEMDQEWVSNRFNLQIVGRKKQAEPEKVDNNKKGLSSNFQ
jgi:phage gp29-like protein